MSLENYGKYQLVKRLAMGGMAQLYLARRLAPDASDELVVVKRILPHLGENKEFVQMFLDEAKIAARLAHPNIVAIYDLGAQDDSFFIAMEYIHGEDVRRMCKRADAMELSLPVPLACRIVSDACAGLDYAHKKTDPSGKPLNIVHRDISPQNILVSFQGGVKVVDFGIAKAADQATVTRSGVLKGKYSYMSPEQASGKRVDCRSDVFALGVVLYELLTGTRLFKRSNDMQTLTAVAECHVTPPSQVSPRVPEELDPIVMRALAKEPEDRYSEALQLQVALEEWLSARQLEATSVELAAFMQRVYAERLAREQRSGSIVVEDDPPVTGQRTAVGAAGRRRTGMSPSVSSKEVTRADRGELLTASAAELAEQEEVEPTDPSSRRSTKTIKSVDLRHEPEAERPRSERRPSAPRNTVDLRRSEVDLPGGNPRAASRMEPAALSITGTTQAPRRERVRRRWGWGVVASLSVVALALLVWFSLRPSAPPPPATVRLETVPPGATVMFAGKTLPDVTPLTLPKVAAGSYQLVISLKGYQDLRAAVAIPSTGAVTLEALNLVPLPAELAPPVAASPREPPPASRDPGADPVTEPLPKQAPPPNKPPRGGQPPRPSVEPAKAMVRFAVTPWAKVTCNGEVLGTTPFPDVVLPVGTYQCKFHNPDEGRTLSRNVEVKAATLNTVKVKF